MQCRRQIPRPFILQYIYHHDDYQHEEHRYTNAYQHWPASHRQAEDQERQKEEAEDDVDNSKPAVGGSDVAKAFSQPDRDAGEGDWVPQSDARDVEKEVHKCNLEKSSTNIFDYIYDYIVFLRP